jgi:hypothetical protein
MQPALAHAGALAPAARVRGGVAAPCAAAACAPLAARRALRGAAALDSTLSAARPLLRTARRRTAGAARASFVDGIADARIKVIGCGGGGGNAVNRMIMAGLQARRASAADAPLAFVSVWHRLCAPT